MTAQLEQGLYFVMEVYDRRRALSFVGQWKVVLGLVARRHMMAGWRRTSSGWRGITRISSAVRGLIEVDEGREP